MTTEQMQSDGRNLKFVAEYRAEPAYAKTMTLEQYVAMRRVDEGYEALKPGSGEEPQEQPSWLVSDLGQALLVK